MINDFIDAGALVYAYSRPVILAKISERARKKYAGVCRATCTRLWASLPPANFAASHLRGWSKQGPAL